MISCSNWHLSARGHWDCLANLIRLFSSFSKSPTLFLSIQNDDYIDFDFGGNGDTDYAYMIMGNDDHDGGDDGDVGDDTVDDHDEDHLLAHWFAPLLRRLCIDYKLQDYRRTTLL